MPIMSFSSPRVSLLASRQGVTAILSCLADAEKSFQTALEIGIQRSSVYKVREACVSLALVTALQTSLGKEDRVASLATASLLGESVETWFAWTDVADPFFQIRAQR